ncbi:MAG: 16S rRNA (guanine(527)-N(7))-methyltransferase RsmG [Bacteroidetes bacterium]|nr:16S rRNA (guanine(527)-N(7))-methyltransferase RsmG [Bacteroidota bacterium]MBP7400870.1 16S rRNA (guanine(527)-N(7))-methyltransferase RsmG [Chitinophagales bacterium]MBK7110095.1 16S rRNA (guanine(527)-N(7))-methyltransferase RsmG [Bacteroidota bacterium]MBK8487180.1 16S rRNA (guanine(527)-N(7))-methyltransferase RsmG [Bacteroidota bacterium]MBK8680566.1 16S rRNA (guanine(527)-N(7))-methyltransferase RsmG [Bacteroidota bacterium]
MEHILKYFPNLSALQKSQFTQLGNQTRFWNEKLNLISRQDADNIYAHHVLHSLAIAKMVEFQPGTRILDLGTGGGFPGLPLAILFPEVNFYLIDSIDKKVRAVEAIQKALGLRNVVTQQMRAEEVGETFDFVVTRAVADLMILYEWTINLISRGNSFNDVPNGLIALKGGYLDLELAAFKDLVYKFPIPEYFSEPWFLDKCILFIPMD